MMKRRSVTAQTADFKLINKRERKWLANVGTIFGYIGRKSEKENRST